MASPPSRAELSPDPDLPRRLGSLGHSYRPDEDVREAVNAALYLRRPLLVTGKPGTGKSTLAYSVAYELRLGPVLYWPISSRSTLLEGLYTYDAIGRLQEAGLRQAMAAAGEVPYLPPDVGRYVRLGPLGTALLPWRRPRVLLIDELDKSDIDLPNDLLNVFEEGRYEIPELARIVEDQPVVEVVTADAPARLPCGTGLCSAGRSRSWSLPATASASFPRRSCAAVCGSTSSRRERRHWSVSSRPSSARRPPCAATS